MFYLGKKFKKLNAFFLNMTSFRNNFQGPRAGSRLILNELWVRSAKYFRIVWFDFCFTFCNSLFILFVKKMFHISVAYHNL